MKHIRYKDDRSHAHFHFASSLPPIFKQKIYADTSFQWLTLQSNSSSSTYPPRTSLSIHILNRMAMHRACNIPIYPTELMFKQGMLSKQFSRQER